MSQLSKIKASWPYNHPYDKSNIFEMRKPINSDEAFSWAHEELLEQGLYRQWFYDGLQDSQLAYLRQPARVDKVTQEPVAYDGWENEQPKNWQHDAACQDVDPVVFFNEGSRPKDAYLKPDAEWREHCPQCPVREVCVSAARDSGSVGIFGGKLFYFDKKSGRIQEIDD